ncbi:DUF1345 domain-containing protein [Curtobacterium sp. MCPF17_002]|uniref:DUF1345 domain-containing protein n=1 Tax=Curtobacterium sp. MCPF17_002 TaxID=2175645 RepID=UPI000DA84AC2|nr:DUF1345 domain-containing protein [Curtobacterium sp. MCPF17_002]WIB77548.1 DUF1345 domain-containing protein [Curtobacterium sp. MCPF17_002]
MTTTRTRPQHEHRAPVAVAILVNLALSLFLPNEVLFFPSWVVPVLGVLLLTPLIVFNPRRLTRETTWSRWLSFALAIMLTVANQLTVLRTLEVLLSGHADGGAVLLTALQVWVSTIIAFGLVYWELDRGGPVARRRPELWTSDEADFQFPQETDAKTAAWRPVYLDYLYVAMTNMMAFSPTDTMPMTVRAKMIMAYQALGGFILLALVISRAVNIIS